MDSGFGYRNGAPAETLPASQYLQERLQERRRNTRPKRLRQTDFGPRRGRDDDIFLEEAEQSRYAAARMYDSSPLTVGMRAGSESGGSGYRKKQSLGVRDVDDQLDRLNKQNFALKLELDHRRDHTVKLQEQLEAMQAQVDRAEVLADEHAELLKINSQLVEELEKRDKAVEEAMDIICDLEEKVADMEERRSNTRPSTANADSGYAGTETHERAPPSSPPELSRPPETPTITTRPAPPTASAASHKLQGMMTRQTPGRLRREPSILSQKKPSTHALRSVYLETVKDLRPVMSFNSLLSKRDSRVEGELPDDVLDSPRLSVLSESSFPSIYSPSPADNQIRSPEKYAWEAVARNEELEFPDDGLSHSRQDSIKRVSLWMEEHEGVEETPSKSNRISSPLAAMQTERGMSSPSLPRRSQESGFQSLNDALSTTSTAAVRAPTETLQPTSYNKPQMLRVDKRPMIQLQQRPSPTSIGGPIFGEPLLPPTPDSASTRMLRASRSSIADERSLLDTTPVPVKGFDALEPGVRTAPKQMRSSIELTSAYSNYQQYRSGAPDDDESSSDEEELDDARSATIKDLSMDYDGFPDGNSILMGTPSRFLKHGQPSAHPTLFGGTDISPPRTANAARSPPMRRRQSSSEATVSPRKPSLSRAETSPTFLGTLGRIVTNGSKSTVDTTVVTSPRSFASGSSSNRTVVQTDAESGSLSPELNRTQSRMSRTSASPARTLGQRTQQLFRRMSNSHSEPRAEREKSPAGASLPTLTSTPSSAYVNHVPKEARRPSTSDAAAAAAKQHTPTGGMSAAQLMSSPREGRRPSLQSRTKTAPESRAASVAAPERARATPTAERKNPFRRTGSVRKDETPPLLAPQHIAPAAGAGEKDGANGGVIRGGMTRRRGSIREAVAGRRPWR